MAKGPVLSSQGHEQNRQVWLHKYVSSKTAVVGMNEMAVLLNLKTPIVYVIRPARDTIFSVWIRFQLIKINVLST